MKSLEISLGVDEFGRPVRIDLAADASHLIIQGQTRSGKSQLAYNLLAQAAMVPEIRLVGIDPTALLLAPVAQRGEDLIALGADDWQGAIDVLRAVKTESDRRVATLVPARMDKIIEFTGQAPLWLVVIEEYPAVLEGAQDEDLEHGRKPGDRLEPRIRRLLRQIVAQSAKAGIRVMLLAQRAEASIIDGASRSNIGTRISLRVDNPDSVRMLHPSADADLCKRVEGFAPGVALIDRPGQRRVVARGPLTTYRDYFDAVVRGWQHAP